MGARKKVKSKLADYQTAALTFSSRLSALGSQLAQPTHWAPFEQPAESKAIEIVTYLNMLSIIKGAVSNLTQAGVNAILRPARLSCNLRPLAAAGGARAALPDRTRMRGQQQVRVHRRLTWRRLAVSLATSPHLIHFWILPLSKCPRSNHSSPPNNVVEQAKLIRTREDTTLRSSLLHRASRWCRSLNQHSALTSSVLTKIILQQAARLDSLAATNTTIASLLY